MPFSSDITLPIEYQPKWPGRCVRCGAMQPGDLFRFRAGRFAWYQLLTFTHALGSRPVVEAPACPGCIPRLGRERWLRTLMDWAVMAVAIGALGLLFYHLGWLKPGPLRYFKLGGASLVVLFVYGNIIALFPPDIDATAQGDKIDYEFKRNEDAMAFAFLNMEQLEEQR